MQLRIIPQLPSGCLRAPSPEFPPGAPLGSRIRPLVWRSSWLSCRVSGRSWRVSGRSTGAGSASCWAWASNVCSCWTSRRRTATSSCKRATCSSKRRTSPSRPVSRACPVPGEWPASRPVGLPEGLPVSGAVSGAAARSAARAASTPSRVRYHCSPTLSAGKDPRLIRLRSAAVEIPSCRAASATVSPSAGTSCPASSLASPAASWPGSPASMLPSSYRGTTRHRPVSSGTWNGNGRSGGCWLDSSLAGGLVRLVRAD